MDRTDLIDGMTRAEYHRYQERLRFWRSDLGAMTGAALLLLPFMGGLLLPAFFVRPAWLAELLALPAGIIVTYPSYHYLKRIKLR